MLGADDLDSSQIPQDAFVVFQGHHGDQGAHLADVILPGCAYTEKQGTFMNTEGRTQLTYAAVNPPGNAREDWKTIRALSELIGCTIPYDDVFELRSRMTDISPNLTHYGIKEPITFTQLALQSSFERLNQMTFKSSETILKSIISNFYMTNSISRNSQTMAKCVEAFVTKTISPEKIEAPGAQPVSQL